MPAYTYHRFVVRLLESWLAPTGTFFTVPLIFYEDIYFPILFGIGLMSGSRNKSLAAPSAAKAFDCASKDWPERCRSGNG